MGATAGGWSKMSDEPVERECEPIERVRARLEALVMANAAPRCGARSKRTGKPCPGAARPNGRCKLHGGKSTGPRTGGPRAQQAGKLETRALFTGSQGGTLALRAAILRSAICATRSRGPQSRGRIPTTPDHL